MEKPNIDIDKCPCQEKDYITKMTHPRGVTVNDKTYLVYEVEGDNIVTSDNDDNEEKPQENDPEMVATQNDEPQIEESPINDIKKLVYHIEEGDDATTIAQKA